MAASALRIALESIQALAINSRDASAQLQPDDLIQLADEHAAMEGDASLLLREWAAILAEKPPFPRSAR